MDKIETHCVINFVSLKKQCTEFKTAYVDDCSSNDTVRLQTNI